MVSRFLGAHIAGKPQVNVALMPGAGGVRLLEHLRQVAPKDGTYIGAFATGPIIEPLISTRKVDYKISDFTAIGALEKDASFCATWHASPIKTIKDAMERETTVAGTAPRHRRISSARAQRDAGHEVQAHQRLRRHAGNRRRHRARRDGRALRLGLVEPKSAKPDWVRDKKLNFLVQLALEKHPEAQDVPLAIDLIPDQAGKQLMKVLVAPQNITRPYLAPPNLPG